MIELLIANIDEFDSEFITYKADFQYIDTDGKTHVIDVKGVLTPVFRLKKKLIEAQHNIEIEIVK